MELNAQQSTVMSAKKKHDIFTLNDVISAIKENGIEGITNRVVNADCLEVMKEMPDKCVDLVLTDPPYGIGFQYEEREKARTPEQYFEFLVPFLEEMKRVSKKYVAVAQTTLYMKYFWNWYGDDIRIYIACKNFVSLRKTFMNYAYDPWVFIKIGEDIRKKDKPKRNLDWTISDTASLRNPKNLERQHPTPKPLKMMKEIIENFTEESDTILDPFMGSGTTLVAANLLGRKAIGIEISEKYCKIARDRLRQEILPI